MCSPLLKTPSPQRVTCVDSWIWSRVFLKDSMHALQTCWIANRSQIRYCYYDVTFLTSSLSSTRLLSWNDMSHSVIVKYDVFLCAVLTLNGKTMSSCWYKFLVRRQPIPTAVLCLLMVPGSYSLLSLSVCCVFTPHQHTMTFDLTCAPSVHR